ncbi:hypothetical protein J6590_002436 [Homalodisca vitripennis]|nr:hypothetical protein J6590_002436 [Homalodisca vitripennis]
MRLPVYPITFLEIVYEKDAASTVCATKTHRDVHQYGTRGRNNFRVEQHRTAAFEHLPSQVGVGLINRLPEGIKQLNETKNSKLD